MMLMKSTDLGKLAVRIFTTPANSVPSEQAFSIQNAFHTKTRNRLSSVKVDKMTYIQRNARAIDNFAAGRTTSKTKPGERVEVFNKEELTEEQLVEIEDTVLTELNPEDVDHLCAEEQNLEV
jgi:hypothetical protein